MVQEEEEGMVWLRSKRVVAWTGQGSNAGDSVGEAGSEGRDVGRVDAGMDAGA